MHAYLLVGQENTNFQIDSIASRAISNLAKKLGAKILEFPLVKIDDVRSLNNLIRLSFNTPTLIVCENIHEAGEEGLNALLKNLEEPQENIYFVLTAPSTRKVLPTIVSRCEIIKVKKIASSDAQKSKVKSDDTAVEFMKMTTGERLAYIDKVKDRKVAIELAESLVNFLHGELHQNDISKACHQMVKYSVAVNNIEIAQKTITRLKRNGNVNLQLSNMVIQIKNGE